MSEIYKLVYKKLRITTSHIKQELSQMIESNGITWQQFHALYYIDEVGTPFNELAKELNCNASNTTGLIDRMTENGWVFREHSEKDRRVWLIKLTEEGNRLRNTLLPLHQDNIQKCMGVLNEQEIQTLDTLLNKLLGTNKGDK